MIQICLSQGEQVAAATSHRAHLRRAMSLQYCSVRVRAERMDAGVHHGADGSSRVSLRVEQTDEPVIVKTKKLMAAAPKVVSLAQGVVHWTPPQQALDAATLALDRCPVHSYGPAAGLPELVSALRAKVATENGLHGHDIMVTAGANQAFVNIVLSLLDPLDRVVLFRPYYFNHLMAIQMTGGAHSVLYGPCHPDSFHPDLDWLEQQMEGPHPPKMVVLVNPCNPTGVLMSKQELETASEICKRRGAWLIVDNTYEHFTYDGRQHTCVSGDHILHIFSFSKAFGMMGWRTGYIAFPGLDGSGDHLALQLTKVQDTIPICPPQLSQHVALAAATRAGRPWVRQQISSILGNRDWLLDALSPLGSLGNGVAGGEGAIYLWARLPPGIECSLSSLQAFLCTGQDISFNVAPQAVNPQGVDDEQWVQQLVSEHGVCVIPGSSCGAPGYIRVAYANLKPAACADAAVRLNKGLKQLTAKKASRQLVSV